MSSNNKNGEFPDGINISDKTVFVTGSTTYSFTQSWVEKDALRDILVGLIADDFKPQSEHMQ